MITRVVNTTRSCTLLHIDDVILTVMMTTRGPSRTQRWGSTEYRNQHLNTSTSASSANLSQNTACTLLLHSFTTLGPLSKSLIALFSTLHLVYGTNSPLIFVSLVRHSLLHFHLLHMAYHHLPSSRSPLASFLTRSVFHSEHKTWLFTKSFPP